MKNLLKPSAKSVLIPLGLTAAASTADAGIHKKKLGMKVTTVIVSNKVMDDIIKKKLNLSKKSGLLSKGVSEPIKNEAKEQKGGFISMVLGTLGASLLRNLFTGKGVIAKIPVRGKTR